MRKKSIRKKSKHTINFFLIKNSIWGNWFKVLEKGFNSYQYMLLDSRAALEKWVVKKNELFYLFISKLHFITKNAVYKWLLFINYIYKKNHILRVMQINQSSWFCAGGKRNICKVDVYYMGYSRMLHSIQQELDG